MERLAQDVGVRVRRGVHGGGHRFLPALAGSVQAVFPLPFSNEHAATPEKSNCELRLLLHKQRERCGVAVQITLFADRPDFAVSEKSGEAGQPELRLD